MKIKIRIEILPGDTGFTFVSLLVALVIVGILASVALTYYRSMGVFGTDRTNPSTVTRRLDLNLTKNTLRQIHDMELSYYQRYNRYATFEDLQRDGLIPGGYTAKLEARGKPFLNYWDIQMKIGEDSYLLIASPNTLANSFEDVPILAMDETGEIREEEGLEDNSQGDESSEDEKPVPFTPEGE
jgi:Tfp pilus assembly protein PilE